MQERQTTIEGKSTKEKRTNKQTNPNNSFAMTLSLPEKRRILGHGTNNASLNHASKIIYKNANPFRFAFFPGRGSFSLSNCVSLRANCEGSPSFLTSTPYQIQNRNEQKISDSAWVWYRIVGERIIPFYCLGVLVTCPPPHSPCIAALRHPGSHASFTPPTKQMQVPTNTQ